MDKTAATFITCHACDRQAVALCAVCSRPLCRTHLYEILTSNTSEVRVGYMDYELQTYRKRAVCADCFKK